ncbi:MAG: ArsR family transcriptional regulator [Spirochaetia bacterium]|jgi:predicted ArsR family transcriptional regulator|nr:ArsR family transcriptional regulator [Spirochaetia bacterium]NLK05270.1 helix-turn-helix transcriptional regulator [Spirochaetales bacterium]
MKTLLLKTDKDLQIFMHPKRQQILHLLSVNASMTAKQISDALAMQPSSAKHHLLRLQELGLVEVDHTELIHGITATFYRKTLVTVSFASLGAEKQKLVSDFIDKQVRDDLYAKPRTHTDESGHFMADQLSGVVHLSEKEADQVYRLIRTFLAKHEKHGEGKKAYAYSLVAYHV